MIQGCTDRGALRSYYNCVCQDIEVQYGSKLATLFFKTDWCAYLSLFHEKFYAENKDFLVEWIMINNLSIWDKSQHADYYFILMTDRYFLLLQGLDKSV